jgi:arylsulfate sulfotransferase
MDPTAALPATRRGTRLLGRLGLVLGTCLVLLSPLAAVDAGASTTITTGAATQGPTVFIASVPVHDASLSTLTSISFSVTPKAGATAAAMSATFTRHYLRSRGWLDDATSTVNLGVWGLYENYRNVVVITAVHDAGHGTTTSSSTRAIIRTQPWNATNCDLYHHMQVLTPRSASVPLDYSYFLLKNAVDALSPQACTQSPLIMDVDGNVRWAGTMSTTRGGPTATSIAATFYDQKIYLGENPGGHLLSETLDGKTGIVGDYSGSYSVSSLGDHNIDPGKNGMLVEANMQSLGRFESDLLEIAPDGTVTKTYDLASILRSYIWTHCGSDPTVSTSGCSAHTPNLDLLANWLNNSNLRDWFHLNAATYWPQRNEIIVSSRENFVMGIDYDTGAPKWILGDTTKAWYTLGPALRPLALSLSPGSVAPIGQHAVSITPGGQLMLFDDGFGSIWQSPAGASRTYSTAQTYAIDESRMRATETWRYTHDKSIYSKICSSIYQLGNSTLLDYAAADNMSHVRLIGLSPYGQVAFDYQISSTGLSVFWGWNALPLALTNLRFAS